MKRLSMLLLAVLLLALAACEDTEVHTTPPAPVNNGDGPTVTIDPPAVGPNETITVTGQGFPPDTVVELTVQRITESFVSQPLGQGQTDADGNVTFTAQVPALWLDGTPLAGPELTMELATEDGDIRGVVTVPYEGEELESFLTVLPSSGAPGQQIELQGVGFEPGQEYVIRVGRTATDIVEEPLETGTVNDDGTFNSVFTLPTTWPDTDEDVTEPLLTFLVMAADSDDVMATVSFTNDPVQTVPEGMDTPAP